MACISPDGKPTESGQKMLRALKAGAASPEAIVSQTGLPLFRVRSGLRELTRAGIAEANDDKYSITSQGAKLVD